ncbi:pentapeptide repeat-containing protein [Dactylosporangium sp. NPDC049525]|uniref:pentapeptide repeat-containing protein n=1 Tax=Dactylosporangium sp. NPDC049525 TaxID=3154730 RepID=UPI003435ADF4
MRWTWLLSNSGVVTIVVAVAGLGVVMLLWMLNVAGHAPDSGAANKSMLRIEAIKYGLGSIAAGGAVAALLLAIRRQVLSERAQRHAERSQRFSETDALEQRATALYVAAANQLGSDKAAVRLAGLYALERLGQDEPKLRQTVVDVWCSYLRMPYTPPAEVLLRNGRRSPDRPAADTDPPDAALESERRQELQVRLTAQRLLAAHMSRDLAEAGEATYWLDHRGNRMVVDLVGAVLVDFTLNSCDVGRCNLSDAQLHGMADFEGVRFHTVAYLTRTQFHGEAVLSEAQFHGNATLYEAQFHSRARLFGAHFHGDANLFGAHFHDASTLHGVQFHGDANLAEAQFHGVALLFGVHFHSAATLRAVQFHSDVVLRDAHFHGDANLFRAQFHGDALLYDAQFYGDAHLVGARFHGTANLVGVQFHGTADLSGAQFHGTADLSQAQFRGAADLSGAQFHSSLNLGSVMAVSSVVVPTGWKLSSASVQQDGLLAVIEADKIAAEHAGSDESIGRSGELLIE